MTVADGSGRKYIRVRKNNRWVRKLVKTSQNKLSSEVKENTSLDVQEVVNSSNKESDFSIIADSPSKCSPLLDEMKISPVKEKVETSLIANPLPVVDEKPALSHEEVSPKHASPKISPVPLSEEVKPYAEEEENVYSPYSSPMMLPSTPPQAETETDSGRYDLLPATPVLSVEESSTIRRNTLIDSSPTPIGSPLHFRGFSSSQNTNEIQKSNEEQISSPVVIKDESADNQDLRVNIADVRPKQNKKSKKKSSNRKQPPKLDQLLEPINVFKDEEVNTNQSGSASEADTDPMTDVLGAAELIQQPTLPAMTSAFVWRAPSRSNSLPSQEDLEEDKALSLESSDDDSVVITNSKVLNPPYDKMGSVKAVENEQAACKPVWSQSMATASHCHLMPPVRRDSECTSSISSPSSCSSSSTSASTILPMNRMPNTTTTIPPSTNVFAEEMKLTVTAPKASEPEVSSSAYEREHASSPLSPSLEGTQKLVESDKNDSPDSLKFTGFKSETSRPRLESNLTPKSSTSTPGIKLKIKLGGAGRTSSVSSNSPHLESSSPSRCTESLSIKMPKLVIKLGGNRPFKPSRSELEKNNPSLTYRAQQVEELSSVGSTSSSLLTNSSSGPHSPISLVHNMNYTHQLPSSIPVSREPELSAFTPLSREKKSSKKNKKGGDRSKLDTSSLHEGINVSSFRRARVDSVFSDNDEEDVKNDTPKDKKQRSTSKASERSSSSSHSNHHSSQSKRKKRERGKPHTTSSVVPPPITVAEPPKRDSESPSKVVVHAAGNSYYFNNKGEQIWLCPVCSMEDDGHLMIGCDSCDDWYHGVCLGMDKEPDASQWFCPKCSGKPLPPIPQMRLNAIQATTQFQRLSQVPLSKGSANNQFALNSSGDLELKSSGAQGLTSTPTSSSKKKKK